MNETFPRILWRPIDQAPRDGTICDLWHVRGFRMQDMRWISKHSLWETTDEYEFRYQNACFTHFMVVTPPIVGTEVWEMFASMERTFSTLALHSEETVARQMAMTWREKNECDAHVYRATVIQLRALSTWFYDNNPEPHAVLNLGNVKEALNIAIEVLETKSETELTMNSKLIPAPVKVTAFRTSDGTIHETETSAILGELDMQLYDYLKKEFSFTAIDTYDELRTWLKTHAKTITDYLTEFEKLNSQ